MQIYKVKFNIDSPTLTPFQSDTIFGHLCWIIVRQEGVKGLRDFLKPFKEGSPPFIISDAFPGDLLPKPFSADFLDEKPDKNIKSTTWVSPEDFDRIRQGKRPVFPNPVELGFKSFSTTHSCISRLTNTTGEDSLYSLKEIVAEPYLSLYLKVISVEWKDKVIDLLTRLSRAGYGRKKSIGKGQFNIGEIPHPYSFNEIKDANGFVTLSNFCPAEFDPTEGFYKIFVKYGKLGEEFTFCGNPFKRSLIMLRTGSVFKTEGAPKEYYGRLVGDGIAPAKPEVVQYAYAFSVPLRYPEF